MVESETVPIEEATATDVAAVRAEAAAETFAAVGESMLSGDKEEEERVRELGLDIESEFIPGEKEPAVLKSEEETREGGVVERGSLYEGVMPPI